VPVLAGLLGALVGAWAAYRVGDSSSFDIYRYGDRAFVLAIFGAIFTGVLAIGAGATRPAGSMRLVAAAAAGVGIGLGGGLIAAAPYGWDSSPRRWLATVWAITGLVAGLGVTVTSRDRGTILLAAALGALGGGVGAVAARGIFTTEEVLGNAGLGSFAAAEMVSGGFVGLAVALALWIAHTRRRVDRPRRAGVVTG
jgi:hypothetical protein